MNGQQFSGERNEPNIREDCEFAPFDRAPPQFHGTAVARKMI
jgi:hypothetical protein